MRGISIHFRSVAILCVAALPLLPAAAGAVCNYIALTSGVTVTVSAEGFCRFDQTHSSWAAAGVRPATGSDWDLFAYSTTAIDPFCVSGDLMSSYLVHGVDVIAGPFQENPLGTYYLGPTRPAGAGPGFVEWDAGADQIVVNDPPVVRAVAADDVIEIWDVALEAGQSYTIYLAAYDGVDAHVLLFRNPPGATYWASRADAEIDAASSANYNAPATGIYGLAVVNDNGAPGLYHVAVFTTQLDAGTSVAPRASAIRGISPNPVARDARIAFDLAAPGFVGFEVLDAAGRIVGRTEERAYDVGRWTQAWMPRESVTLRAGVYFVRMRLDGQPLGVIKAVLVE